MQSLYTFEQYDIVKSQRDKYYNQLKKVEKRNVELVEALKNLIIAIPCGIKNDNFEKYVTKSIQTINNK